MKKADVLIVVLSVLSVLILVNIILNFQNRGIEDVTGRVVSDAGDSGESSDGLADEVAGLRSENERLILEKSDLLKKIEELEAKIEAFEEEKELKEETCPLPCGVEEICSPINKKDGSVEREGGD